MSRCAIDGNSYQPTQQRVRAPTPAGRDKTTQRVGRGSVSGIVEGGCLRSDARAAAPQTVCAPSEGIHPIGSGQPVWGHSTREARFQLIGSIAPDQNGLNDHRWGVSPHRQQAPSRTWSPVRLPRFCRRRLSGVYRHRPTRACAAGPVGALSQRAARPCPRPSMSHVIPLRLVQMLNSHRWNCNVFGWSRKVTEGKLRAKYVWRLSGRRLRVPWLGSCLEARPRSPALRPLCLGACRADDGGFAALEASCRRVAGVSRLYCCNSPRLAAPSTWGELDRVPLTAQVPPFAGCEVTVQGGEVAVQGSMAPKVPTTSATNADNRVSMRAKGAHARTMRSHKHKRAPRLAGVPTLSLCPGRRQRRDPQGSRLSSRTVAAPSALKSRPTSNTISPTS